MTASLAGQVALVTGGTRGIGRAIVDLFAARGARVFACARHSPADGLPAGAAFVACDVADPTGVAELFKRVRDEAGRLDLLVNNAGLAGANPLDGDDGAWRAILATNLDGTYHCSKAALPLLADGSGRIVNVASTLGLRGIADQTAYCAAKHGVVGFTRALSLALAPRGITVNAVCPGWVDTGMARSRFASLGITAADAARDTPAGRLTTAAEVADLVAYLCTPAAASITGQAIVIDGGASV